MPVVSIIIPCFNEQKTIGELLDAIYRQTFPREILEVVIADGLSTDNTREQIRQFQQSHPDLCLQVVDNPRRVIPAALNRAIAAARGEWIVRLDAHSVPQVDYVARCVEALQAGKGANVGGVWDICPGGAGWMARAIAVVAAHPLGIGDARYRYTTQAGPVDTVPFGAYSRAEILGLGGYDETLLTNEDYELNTRIRQMGGVIWLDPAIRSVYYARPTFAALARQYVRYGYWKLRMLRRYPRSLRWRQALPPLFVLSLVILALAALGIPLARLALAGELIVYFGVLELAGIQAAVRQGDASLLFGFPLGIATMHLAWGGGFLWSGIRSLFQPSLTE